MSNWTMCRSTILRAMAWMLLCLPALAAAQGAPQYELHNTSNETLTFSTMDPARGSWKEQTIHPNERKSYVWRSGAHQGKIRIATEGRGHVEYDVRAGHRYAVVWDERKGVWDFRSRGTMADAGGNGAQPPAGRGHAQPQQAWGQPQGYGQVQHASTGAQPQQASWSLYNRSNERLEFQTLDPARGTWRNQVTHPHQQASFTFSPGMTAGKIRVATTDRGYVEYDVYAGGNYNLIWDRNKGMWDLRTVRNGG
jgi:hypothetical protein